MFSVRVRLTELTGGDLICESRFVAVHVASQSRRNHSKKAEFTDVNEHFFE